VIRGHGGFSQKRTAAKTKGPAPDTFVRLSWIRSGSSRENPVRSQFERASTGPFSLHLARPFLVLAGAGGGRQGALLASGRTGGRSCEGRARNLRGRKRKTFLFPGGGSTSSSRPRKKRNVSRLGRQRARIFHDVRMTLLFFFFFVAIGPCRHERDTVPREPRWHW